MKNRFLIAALSFIAAGMISCGNPAEPENFILSTENVDRCISSVGQYKDLKVIITRDSLTDESIDYYTDLFFEKQAESIEGWQAETGDTVVIDYNGYFAGTEDIAVSGKNQKIVIGKNSLIKGFDAELAGTKAGDIKEFTLSFPEDYHAEALAGTSCDFKVEVRSVIPTLSDKAVAALNSEVYTNVNEYRVFIYYTLKEYADKDYSTRLVREVLTKAAADSKFNEIPESLMEQAKAFVEDRYADTAESYNLDVAKYLEYCGTSLDAEAEEYAKEQILIYKIARDEGLGTEEDADAETISKNVFDYIVSVTNQ